MFRKFLVKKDERALVFRRDDFLQVLGSGEHTFPDPLWRLSLVVFPLSKTHFEHRLAD